MSTRVWITGAGAITSLGAGFDAVVAAMHAPRANFSSLPSEWLAYPGAPDAFMATLGAKELAAIKPFENMSTDRATALALTAADEAWQHAGFVGLLGGTSDPTRAGVYWGTGMSGLHTVEASYHRQLIDKAALRPMTVVRIMANASAGQMAVKYGLQGPNQTYSVACASSAMALGEAMWAIRSGRLDVALVGGCEAMLAPVVMDAWGALRVIATKANSKNHDLPCRPFSLERSGLVVGEGAAAFVLESDAHSKRRGARPLAELAGFASTCDATSMVHPDSQGQIRAMQGALRDAGLTADAIDSVNAHATATDTGDVIEAQALASVFAMHHGKIKPTVAATKSMHGHLLGATGAVEAAFCVASLLTQTTPATLGLDPLDPRCSHINVAGEPRTTPIKAVLSNSFAFGGSNTSLIFKLV
jgi:3-oxoacyl-(acyl-carrier-protein) synthase